YSHRKSAVGAVFEIVSLKGKGSLAGRASASVLGHPRAATSPSPDARRAPFLASALRLPPIGDGDVAAPTHCPRSVIYFEDSALNRVLGDKGADFRGIRGQPVFPHRSLLEGVQAGMRWRLADRRLDRLRKLGRAGRGQHHAQAPVGRYLLEAARRMRIDDIAV